MSRLKRKIPRKYALLIGILYKGTDEELEGCIKDVKNVKNYLLENGYDKENIVEVTDNTKIKPTKENILCQLNTLFSQEADELVLSYSGHGRQIKEKARNQCICPIDHKEKGIICDKMLNAMLCSSTTKSRIICLFDACYSATFLDLPYNYVDNKEVYLESCEMPNDIICFSSSKDTQVSMDTKKGGVMTSLILPILRKEKRCFKVLELLRKEMKKRRYRQVPQICSSRILTKDSILL